MEVANFSSPLETIGMISSYTYLIQIGMYINNKNYRNTDVKSPFSVINAFVPLWDEKYSNYDKRMKLVRQLIKKSDLYGEKWNEKLDDTYINLMFDYIVTKPIFKKYGNIYGFLAEIARTSDNLKIDVILKNANNTLKNLTHQLDNELTLQYNVIRKIFQKLIEPLFPKSMKHENLDINSVDFIYAQAGWTLYNSNLMTNDHLFDLTPKKIAINYEEYMFDDCVELAIAVEELVISGQIKNDALRIFALPALLLYAHHNKDDLLNKDIRTIVNDTYHWNLAYSQLFAHLRYSINSIRMAQDQDPIYQYYLNVYQFEDQRIMAAQEILENCESVNESQFEMEVDRFVNNSANYTCLNGNKLLTDVGKIYLDQVAGLVDKYHRFEEQDLWEGASGTNVSLGDANGFLEGINGSLSSSNGSLSSINGSLSSTNGSLSTTNGTLDVINSSPSSTNSTLEAINGSLSSANDSKLFQKHKNQPTSFVINQKLFLECNKTEKSMFESRFLEPKTNASNTNKNSSEELRNIEKLYNDTQLEIVHCLSSLYPCMAGIIEGNPVNSSTTCPLKGSIRFQEMQSLFLDRFTSARTRNLLSQRGTTLRTIALKTSMQTALSTDNYIWKRKMDLKAVTDILVNVGFTKNPAIDQGFEIAASLGVDGLNLVTDLLKKIEREFFISYQSKSRNFSANSWMVSRMADKVARKFDKDIYLKKFYGKDNNYYGYRFVEFNGKIAELRSIKGSSRKKFVTRINEGNSTGNRKLYKIVNITNNEIEDPVYSQAPDGRLYKMH